MNELLKQKESRTILVLISRERIYTLYVNLKPFCQMASHAIAKGGLSSLTDYYLAKSHPGLSSKHQVCLISGGKLRRNRASFSISAMGSSASSSSSQKQDNSQGWFRSLTPIL